MKIIKNEKEDDKIQLSAVLYSKSQHFNRVDNLTMPTGKLANQTFTLSQSQKCIFRGVPTLLITAGLWTFAQFSTSFLIPDFYAT